MSSFESIKSGIGRIKENAQTTSLDRALEKRKGKQLEKAKILLDKKNEEVKKKVLERQKREEKRRETKRAIEIRKAQQEIANLIEQKQAKKTLEELLKKTSDEKTQKEIAELLKQLKEIKNGGQKTPVTKETSAPVAEPKPALPKTPPVEKLKIELESEPKHIQVTESKEIKIEPASEESEKLESIQEIKIQKKTEETTPVPPEEIPESRTEDIAKLKELEKELKDAESNIKKILPNFKETILANVFTEALKSRVEENKTLIHKGNNPGRWFREKKIQRAEEARESLRLLIDEIRRAYMLAQDPAHSLSVSSIRKKIQTVISSVSAMEDHFINETSREIDINARQLLAIIDRETEATEKHIEDYIEKEIVASIENRDW
mgnify:CR=1 FL=1